MKPPATSQTSLSARMRLLFGLLVTVPLVISGIVLSFTGWNRLHRSQRQIALSAGSVVQDTARTFEVVSGQKLRDAATSVAGIAERNLERTSNQAVAISTREFRENSLVIRQQGEQAVRRATQNMVAVSDRELRGALEELRTLNAGSLNLLSRNFSDRMEAELRNSDTSVEDRLNASIMKSWNVSADRRLVTVEEVASRAVSQILIRLQLPAQTQTVVRGPSPDLGPFLENFVRKNDPDIIRVVLVSPTGVEYGRVPETEKEEEWEETATYKAVQSTASSESLSIAEPLRFDDRSKRWIRRIAYRVIRSEQDAGKPPEVEGAPKEPFEQTTPFLVIDYAVEGVVRRAVTGSLSPGMEAFLISEKTGQVISAVDPAKVGSPLQRVLDRMPKPPAAGAYAQTPFEFAYQNPSQMLGLARYWKDDACWAVVVQPQSSVLEPVKDLKEGIKRSWEEALNNITKTQDDFIEERLIEGQRRNQAALDKARAGLAGVESQARRDVTNALAKAQTDAIARMERQINQDVDHLRERARDAIQESAAAQATLAARSVSQDAGRSAAQAQESIEREAGVIARQAAGQMLLNSAWLIPLFLIMALGLAALTTRSLVRPIDRLVAGTQNLARGRYDQRIPVEGKDELAQLAAHFNNMAEAIEAGRAELQTSHDNLAAEKARIEAILNASPDGLVLLTREDQIALLNPTALKMLRLRSFQIPEGPFSLDLLPSDAAQHLRRCMDQVRDSGESVEYEIKEPERRVLQVREVRLRGGRGRPQGRLIHLHDVTREKVIDEMKSDFISLVSHELRTPLTSILGFSSYLLMGRLGALSETQRTALESVNRQSKRLSAIISDFLDVSRIESGKIEMRKEPVSILHVADRVMEDLRPQAAEKAVKVSARLEGPDGHALAMGDEQRISQVLTNLVGNALKFTEKDGSIDVVLSRQNGDILCQVRDTGCGIPPDELPRVFDRFYQVEKVVTRKTGGTGLGLAIVKNIVEAHGGRIWIESEPGRGTEVSFTLPAA